MVNINAILTNTSLFISMGFFLLFILIRQEIIVALKRKFFRGKGWVTIRMYMPDRQEKEDFINLSNNPTIDLFGRSYMYNAKAATFKAEFATDHDEPKTVKTKSTISFKPSKKKTIVNVDPKEKTVVNVDPEGKIEPSDHFNLKLDSFTRSGKFPVLSYRYDRADPIDIYALDKGMDSALFSSVIIRAKAQSSIKDLLGQNKKTLMYIMIVGFIAAASAYFSYESSTALKLLLARGPGLG